jgi:hypothetical protein
VYKAWKHKLAFDIGDHNFETGVLYASHVEKVHPFCQDFSCLFPNFLIVMFLTLHGLPSLHGLKTVLSRTVERKVPADCFPTRHRDGKYVLQTADIEDLHDILLAENKLYDRLAREFSRANAKCWSHCDWFLYSSMEALATPKVRRIQGWQRRVGPSTLTDIIVSELKNSRTSSTPELQKQNVELRYKHFFEFIFRIVERRKSTTLTGIYSWKNDYFGSNSFSLL